MNYILKNATIFIENEFKKMDIMIKNSKISLIGVNLQGEKIIDCKNKLITSSFIDLHVHSRTPGYEYKEDIKTLTQGALIGGYTNLISMPNVNPTPDNQKTLISIKKHIKHNSNINICQSATLTKKREGKIATDFKKIKGHTNFVSDDGCGVENSLLMHQLLLEAKKNDLTMLIHPENLDFSSNGCVSVCDFAKKHKLKEILPEAEELMIGRDLILNQRINAKLHFCHVSTKNGIDLILKLKTPNTTFEVAPHHLILSTEDLKSHGNYKMNPPLRSKSDVDYLVKKFAQEKISIIATDHAPHSKEEKNVGLKKSMFGIIGLESCFPLLYTKLVLKNKVSLKHLINSMTYNPGKLLGLNQQIKVGLDANLCVLNLNEVKTFDESMIGSKSKNTPFLKQDLCGYVEKTIYKGNILYEVNNEI